MFLRMSPEGVPLLGGAGSRVLPARRLLRSHANGFQCEADLKRVIVGKDVEEAIKCVEISTYSVCCC